MPPATDLAHASPARAATPLWRLAIRSLATPLLMSAIC